MAFDAYDEKAPMESTLTVVQFQFESGGPWAATCFSRRLPPACRYGEGAAVGGLTSSLEGYA
jgi:hypothetical protein